MKCGFVFAFFFLNGPPTTQTTGFVVYFDGGAWTTSSLRRFVRRAHVCVRVCACVRARTRACAYTVTLVWGAREGAASAQKAFCHFFWRQRKRFVLWRKNIVVAGSAPASPDRVIVYGSFGGMAPAKGFSTRASSQPVARVQTRVQMGRGPRRWASVSQFFPTALISYFLSRFVLNGCFFAFVEFRLVFPAPHKRRCHTTPHHHISDP